MSLQGNKNKKFNLALGESGYDLVLFPERTGEKYQYGDNLQTTNKHKE
jgi:hypothetical protein